jgi:hypothetical protein
LQEIGARPLAEISAGTAQIGMHDLAVAESPAGHAYLVAPAFQPETTDGSAANAGSWYLTDGIHIDSVRGDIATHHHISEAGGLVLG